MEVTKMTRQLDRKNTRKTRQYKATYRQLGREHKNIPPKPWPSDPIALKDAFEFPRSWSEIAWEAFLEGVKDVAA